MRLGPDIGAVVTGGASGLGAATARMLAETGVKVALLDVDQNQGETLARELGGFFCRCDVTDPASISAALIEARKMHGQERVLVNCAGIVSGSRIARLDRETGATQPHDPATFARVIAVNLTGTFAVSAQSAAGMLKLEPVTEDGGRGVIVMTSSVAAEDGQIGQVAYAASKGGVASMTLPMARDLALSGIRVVSIMPGLFETPMFASLSDEVREALGRSVPFPARLGRACEYAALVRQICENDMLNGTSIRLDGAVRLPPK